MTEVSTVLVGGGMVNAAGIMLTWIVTAREAADGAVSFFENRALRTFDVLMFFFSVHFETRYFRLQLWMVTGVPGVPCLPALRAVEPQEPWAGDEHVLILPLGMAAVPVQATLSNISSVTAHLVKVREVNTFWTVWAIRENFILAEKLSNSSSLIFWRYAITF